MKQRIKLDEVVGYATLGLKRNPFPSTGTVEGYPELYFNQKNVISSLSHILSSAISTRKSANIVLTGTYGSGKSHTLRYVQSAIRSSPRQGHCRPMCIYVPQPGRSPIEFARQFFVDMGPEIMTNLARGFVSGQEEKLDTSQRNDWSDFETGNVLLAEAIRKSLPTLNAITKFPDFSRAFISLCLPDTQFNAWSWICGERLEGGIRRKLGLTGNLSSQDAVRIVVALIRVMEAQSVSPLMILLDEFEAIETLPGRQKQEILFNLRWLMDQCPYGLVLLIACAPEVWAQISAQYHAFSARIGAQIGLRPLKLDEVNDLVSNYLASALMETRHRTIISRDLIKRIYELSEGNTRRILMLFHDSLEQAATSGSSLIEECHLPPWVE